MIRRFQRHSAGHPVTVSSLPPVDPAKDPSNPTRTVRRVRAVGRSQIEARDARVCADAVRRGGSSQRLFWPWVVLVPPTGAPCGSIAVQLDVLHPQRKEYGDRCNHILLQQSNSSIVTATARLSRLLKETTRCETASRAASLEGSCINWR
jgi:hypothetical protein